MSQDTLSQAQFNTGISQLLGSAISKIGCAYIVPVSEYILYKTLTRPRHMTAYLGARFGIMRCMHIHRHVQPFLAGSLSSGFYQHGGKRLAAEVNQGLFNSALSTANLLETGCFIVCAHSCV